MEILNYYIKTLSAVGGKLLPVGVFLLVGYFLFIKLPFLFMRKVQNDNKAKDNPQFDNKPKESPQVETKKEAAVEFKTQTQSKNDYQERLAQAREEKARQQKRREQEEPKKSPPNNKTTAEEIFEIPAGQVLNKSELKKRYFELLKQNHPDKVASLGNDFKVLAEKKTKAINTAYEELKKKSA
jgi:hypothetical protein